MKLISKIGHYNFNKSIGLSKDYNFIDNEPLEVEPEDKDLLLKFSGIEAIESSEKQNQELLFSNKLTEVLEIPKLLEE